MHVRHGIKGVHSRPRPQRRCLRVKHQTRVQPLQRRRPCAEQVQCLGQRGQRMRGVWRALGCGVERVDGSCVVGAGGGGNLWQVVLQRAVLKLPALQLVGAVLCGAVLRFLEGFWKDFGRVLGGFRNSFWHCSHAPVPCWQSPSQVPLNTPKLPQNITCTSGSKAGHLHRGAAAVSTTSPSPGSTGRCVRACSAFLTACLALGSVSRGARGHPSEAARRSNTGMAWRSVRRSCASHIGWALCRVSVDDRVVASSSV